METKNKDDHKGNSGQPADPFREILRVMNTEDLIRICRRLEKIGQKRITELLTEEIASRDASHEECA